MLHWINEDVIVRLRVDRTQLKRVIGLGDLLVLVLLNPQIRHLDYWSQARALRWASEGEGWGLLKVYELSRHALIG